MHTQTESAPEHPAVSASLFPAAGGLGLYLLTLAVEALLGASSRWLLAYLGAATAGLLLPLGLSAEQLAWIAAIAPLAHSAIGLVLPGQGWLWRRRLGARQPSSAERDLLDDAIGLLAPAQKSIDLDQISILDDPLPGAAVRGRALVLTRGLLDTPSPSAVLAHELGHLRSTDGRLTEALSRLAIWHDPLGPAEPQLRARPTNFGDEGLAGPLWSALRLLLRAAAGGTGERLLAPLWAAYWRRREYAADAFAASLGLAEDLVTHLEGFEQPFDVPDRGLLFRAAEHPPVAHRIDHLLAGAEGGGSK